MALINTFHRENNFGLQSELRDCYVKVSNVAGCKSSVTVEFCVFSADKQRCYFTETRIFTPEMGGKDFIAQAYAYLKSLPEFNTAVDC